MLNGALLEEIVARTFEMVNGKAEVKQVADEGSGLILFSRGAKLALRLHKISL